ncbi:FAD-dependent monooxygenase [Pigmentiphaga sp. GD03639]|uniref:FAD-dependent oxidoreductase n=1 Tax=unclassified Pigmentiphaga TaxID=2626614 RepID=UPI002449425E|nr:FAD-dependent oxidoreductase [Pigmentiphaga sp. GD03639]MDH2239055.1 FAD-dependent monooxygenase [Pigmentiphaga sp. GD03639]
MNGATVQVDVAICGGGPVGLALAYLLGREGLRVALFEKRPSTTVLPKGQYVHASTAELYRQWGVWELLEGKGWSIPRSNGQGFYVRIAQGPVADVRSSLGTDAEYEHKWAQLAPVYPRKVPASDYEAALRHQAAAWQSVALHFGTQVVDVEDLGRGVRLSVKELESGLLREVGARYLVACDGARSFVRNRIGRGEDHGPTFGNQVLAEFRADLDDTLGRDGYFHSFVLDPRYAGWFGSKHPDTGLWRYSFRHDEDPLPDTEALLERIRGALGMPELPVEIVRVYRFDYTTGLLRKWREGNVLFAGDAAHWHSPWGGFGANTGVQDANNLAWKLGLVLRGAAPDTLLDTYEVERKGKALLTVKAATYNSLNFQAIAAAIAVGEPGVSLHGTFSPQAVAFLRECVAPHGDNSVLHTGFQLGTVYDSAAVIRDGDQPPRATLEHYEESTVPGVRAPHVWLYDSAGRRLSTVDLWGTAFSLVVQRDVQAWTQAARAVGRELGVALRVVHIGPEGHYRADEPKFGRLYPVADGGAVLVRPDGFVARRLPAQAGGAAGPALRDTLRRLLTLEPDTRAAASLPGQEAPVG